MQMILKPDETNQLAKLQACLKKLKAWIGSQILKQQFSLQAFIHAQCGTYNTKVESTFLHFNRLLV